MTTTNERNQPAQPLGVASTEGLGPLPRAEGMAASRLLPASDGVFGPLYTARQMRAYAAEQVAAERERCISETLDALSNQVAFWLANRYHEMPSIQRQIDRENELIEEGVSSAVESVRRRILGPNAEVTRP